MLSRPFLTRIPDQSMVLDAQEETSNYVIATRDSEGSYAMIYFPTGKTTNLDLSKIEGTKVNGWWFDPRTGNAFPTSEINPSKKVTIAPPTSGKGHDWVLVVDDASKNFTAPGKRN